MKKLVNIKYLELNKKTQTITPTMFGELVYEVVNASISQLLNPDLTASWEKGLTYVANGEITSREYMDKLEHFIKMRTGKVKEANYQHILLHNFTLIRQYYKPEKKKSEKTNEKAGEKTGEKTKTVEKKKSRRSSK